MDEDTEVQLQPSFEQISQQRIIFEVEKSLNLLKTIELLLQDRSQCFSTFLLNKDKFKLPTEDNDNILFPEASLNIAMNSMFGYLEQVTQTFNIM